MQKSTVFHEDVFTRTSGQFRHTTYAVDIKIEFEEAADALKYFYVQQDQFELDSRG
jgi:hypothetical protein